MSFEKLVIGAKLKDYLAAKGIRTIDVADLTDFTASTTVQYLSGNKYSELFWRRLADALNMRYDEFVDRFNEREAS